MVRSPSEILATVDADGSLDGLPFMPEMLGWCGKPFRVKRRVVKTCVDVTRGELPTRRFPADDVVLLTGPRCDGAGHDDCRRGCRVFWKEAWLRPADESDEPAGFSDQGLEEFRSRLKTRSNESHYHCQSTELCRATEAFPGRQKPWAVRNALREIRNGDLGVTAIGKLFALWSWQRMRRAAGGSQWLRGPHKRTPSESLGLQPGERVRVKSRDQIIATLDDRRRNRGLGICHEVMRCCDGEAEVRFRVDRMIDERTGKMREVHDTVTLQNLQGQTADCEECLCYDELGDCPRGELMFWREIWLERVVKKS